MSKGSNPSNVTTTTATEPSEFIRPYLSQAIDYSQDLFESDLPQFFPDATYTGFAPETETALDLATARATAGSPLLNLSQQEANRILSGDYLSPTTNPYSQALFNQMADDVTSKVQSQFSAAGRLGSAANQEVLADSLGRLANEVYSDQFNRERDAMINTMSTAPTLGAADYQDIERLAQVGADKEALANAKLQDAINRFDFEQQKPFIKLNEYLGALGANVPTTTVETQPVFRDRVSGLLGGAGAGINIASQLGLSPMAGAIGGGLLGGFF
jgi:hypothetical protein|tara:strand:+ start:3214 stop:4029 length:816 start_codon:yes stop_codon:yes gene_type:complete